MLLALYAVTFVLLKREREFVAGIALGFGLDDAAGVHDGGVVTAAEIAADFFEGMARVATGSGLL